MTIRFAVRRALAQGSAPIALLMFLLPALATASRTVAQDTVKSALLVCAVPLIALLHRLARRAAPLRLHTILLAPLGLAACAAVSMAWSDARLGGEALLRWCVVGLLVWLLLDRAPQRQSQRRCLALGVHAGASAAALWAAAQFWGGLDLVVQGPMPGATFYNRNFFAEYAVTALPYSLWLFAQSRRWWAQLAMAVTLALNLSTLLMTGTRSALLALALVLPCALWLLARLRRHWLLRGPAGARSRWLSLGVLVAALALLLPWPSTVPKVLQESAAATPWERGMARAATLTSPGQYQSGSFALRTDMWLATLRMVHDHPWAGVGAGAWEVFIPRYQPADATLEFDYYAHNEYLQLLGEYGLPAGGLVLALLLAYWIRSAATTAALADNAPAEALWRGCILLSLLALATVAAAGFPLHLAGTLALFALGLGLLAASDSHSPLPACAALARTLHPPPVARTAWLLVLVAATVAAGWLSVRAITAEHLALDALLRIERLPRSNAPLSAAQQADKAQALAQVRQALAINPRLRKYTGLVAEVTAAQQDWRNTAWILQSVADTNPYVPGIWQGLVLAHASLNEAAQARAALAHLQALRPHARATHNMEAVVLAAEGRDGDAQALLERAFDAQNFDEETTQIAYALGLKTRQQALAVRALTLRAQHWPPLAADSWYRMGVAYAEIAPRNERLAVAAFAHGWHSLAPALRAAYLAQVPSAYRQRVQDSVPP